jgi:hypothetical protein
MNIINRLKIYFLAFLILPFVACEETNTKSNTNQVLEDINVVFKEQFSFGHFYPRREVVYNVQDKTLDFKNIPDNFTDYEIKSFNFNLAQSYYQDFKNQKISAEEFEMLQQIYKFEAPSLSSEPQASKVNILIGELENGNRAVVVDTNLDFDFADEEIQEFEYPIQFIDEEDEAFFEENKVELLLKAKVQAAQKPNINFNLLMNPYEGDLKNTNYTEKYFLSMSIPQLKTFEFQVADQNFVLEAKSNFTQYYNNPNNLQFLVYPKNDSTETEIEPLRFQLGEVIHLNDYDFKLTRQNGEFIFQNLGFNDTPTGVSEGFYLPEIKTHYLDAKPYSAEEYKDQFQLFYFWTTWSLPSLEGVADLKKLKEENPELAIVGVAVDANQGAVERMALRQQMPWKNLYAPTNSPNETKPAIQFKVMSFPTFILVNPEQKIIKRTHHLREVVDVLEN